MKALNRVVVSSRRPVLPLRETQCHTRHKQRATATVPFRSAPLAPLRLFLLDPPPLDACVPTHLVLLTQTQGDVELLPGSYNVQLQAAQHKPSSSASWAADFGNVTMLHFVGRQKPAWMQHGRASGRQRDLFGDMWLNRCASFYSKVRR